MSEHVTLGLHVPEEQLQIDLGDSVKGVPPGGTLNPIADYFDRTSRLKSKILSTAGAADAELLGLMVLGVISSAEFYFRSILGRIVDICPLCARHAESSQVPIGAFEFYSASDYCFILGSMEHESLADAKKVASSIERFSGFKTATDSSVAAALDGYERLCELRHCLAHARGFVGLKGSRALGIPERRLSKVLLNQAAALEVLKLAHNAVRAVNRFVANSLVNRWIDKDIISGDWNHDRAHFMAVWQSFAIKGEDTFGGSVRSAYSPVRRAALKRQQAIAGKLAP